MLQWLRAHNTFAEDQSRVLVPATTQGDFQQPVTLAPGDQIHTKSLQGYFIYVHTCTHD